MGMLALRIEGRRVELHPGRPIVIGRAPDADVTVDAATASRHHLRVDFDGERWLAHDLGGLNGTFVNGARVPAQGTFRLEPGLKIMLGHPSQGLDVAVLPDASARSADSASVASSPSARSPRSPDPMQGLTLSGDGISVVELTTTDASGLHTTTSKGFAPRIESITIGRGSDNTIVVHDPLVSVHHARLTQLAPGHFRVEDLRSTNGTFVDGVRIATRDATVGAVVSVGKIFLRVTPEGLQRIAQSPATPVMSPSERSAPGPRPRPGGISLSVSGVTFTVPTNKAERDKGADKRKRLLDSVTFNVPERSLLAVIGPSGAGKSTMLKTMIGALKPDAGQVLFNSLDMAVFADSLSNRIGMVPQDDLVHVDLTARQALGYAARLRFPDDSTRAERSQAVEWAMGRLGLGPHADTKIRQMSGGQRKRVSTAMELLTRPDLLFLDEPTSGLDPNLDREVMALLRDLAHGTPDNPDGRTVVVITHSTANLDKADNVLLLAPGGKVAYFGPPAGLQDYFAGPLRGDRSFASIYALIARDPDAARAAFARTPLAQRPAPILPVPHGFVAAGAPPKRLLPQSLILLARQARLLISDRSLLTFTVVLPIVMGLVTLAVRATDGFNPASVDKSAGDPKILLVVLVFGAVLMGMVPSVRQLVGERAIFRREAGVGVRPSAYLASKVLLLGVVSAIQSALLVAVTLALNAHPAAGVWGPLWLELMIVAFAVSWTCAALGLLLSALVSTSDQVMPLMVVVLMLQLVLCGGVIGVNSPGVNEVSWLVPSRWGYAAGASTIDLNRSVTCHAEQRAKAKADDEINKKGRESTDKANQEAADQAKKMGQPAPTPKVYQDVHTTVDCSTLEDNDTLWDHDTNTWALDAAFLGFYFLLYCSLTFGALRRQVR